MFISQIHVAFFAFSSLNAFFSFIVLVVTTTMSAAVFYRFGGKINQQIVRNLSDIADHKAAEISNVLLFERINLLSWRALGAKARTARPTYTAIAGKNEC